LALNTNQSINIELSLCKPLSF